MAILEMEIPDAKIQAMLRGDRGIEVLLEPILNQILQAEMTEHLKQGISDSQARRADRRSTGV